MAFAHTGSVALLGVDGVVVEVQADLEPGVAAFTIVGLPDKALSEARDRVRAAVVNSGEKWPQRKLTVGLSPASVPKSGSGFDLSMARRKLFYVATLATMKTTLEGGRVRVVIYARISDDREGRGAGVERQERDCRNRADRNGWDVVAVLVENDLSAYSGKPRPKYEQMLAMIRAGEVDAVLALSPKRLYRQIGDAFDFFDLIIQKNIKVETIKQGRFDLSTAEGRRDARRAAIDGQYESEEISERVKDAKADNLAAGEYRGGPRPFAYEADGRTLRSLQCPQCGSTEGFTADRECEKCGAAAVNVPESEAWHTEAAMDSVIAGDSLRSICAAWATKGITSAGRRRKQPDGTRGEVQYTPVDPTGLRRILLRPRNAGLIEHDGEIVGRAVWPAVTTEEKWRACKAILENPERRTTTSNGRVWLGSGIYRCWCGETVRGSTTGVGGTTKAAATGKTHKPAYRCRTGKHVIRDVFNMDAYIEGLAVERLSRPDAMELLLPPATAEPQENLAADANALRAKLDSIAADYAADLLTRKQALDATSFTRARLESVTARMAGRAATSVLASVPLGTPEVAELWPGYHLDKRRAIIDALMTVIIHPARRGRVPGFKPGKPGEPKEPGQTYFDDTTIEITWKGREGS
ncbi:recombinase family protein [Streptacidiphilus sp. PB12-B1b]|uniref:recombinase family protein n=1 Tax=Streptacidiphilus sp. PB12-B1b TaxID=2705012 RepID=UPI0015FC3658|nr:recombinase family protein [Streptacidiphilus sp. PB12-B1b]QMU78905.1 recombinase family protein [Streptacidiphilus sp. PB12-B1b]